MYDRHVLLTHPQASSLKPNQTPYRSVVVYPKGEEDNMKDIMLIEKCIETFRQWQDIARHRILMRTRWQMTLKQLIYQ